LALIAPSAFAVSPLKPGVVRDVVPVISQVW
jgi:hypothetical protein